MESVLEAIESDGLEVLQVKVAVKCSGCGHEWQLRLLRSEVDGSREPNPNWSKCWVCRERSKTDPGGHA